METKVGLSSNYDFIQILSKLFDKVCGELIFIFNSSGEIVFNKSNFNISNLNDFKRIFCFTDKHFNDLLTYLTQSKTFDSYEFIDYLTINKKSNFAKIVINTISYKTELLYSVLIRLAGEDLCNECGSKFKAIFVKAPVGIASVDADTGKIIEVNPEFCNMIGYSEEELLSKTVSEITLSEDFENEKNLAQKLAENSYNKFEFIKRYIKKDGSILYANLTTTLIKGYNKNIVMGIILDISNSIKLMQAEKEKKDFIEKISLTTPDTILIFNLKSQTFTFYNHNLFRNELIENEEFTFIKFLALIHPNDIQKFLEQSNQLTFEDENKIHECSFRILINKDEVKWVLCRGIVFSRETKGRNQEILFQITDITSQKELEQSLRESFRQLDEKNKILENQKQELLVAKNELEQSRQQLIEANINKDKFFSIIAHDLKNPFNSLFGSASFLSKNFEICDKNDIKILTDNIYNSAKVIYALLENLLSWARLQTNRLTLNFECINLTELINNILPLYKDILHNKKISVELNFKSDVCYADRYTLETTIRNLISNAIKFSFEGSKIIIGTEKKEEDLIIFIKDFGTGMSKEKVETIFIDTENKTTPGTMKETGTGLGLLICKEFAEKNNGKIWVESEINKGSTFFVSIPANNPKAS
jgi:PAS domain S-box-containing protein